MLAELTVEDVDAKRPGAPLFVRCRHDDEQAEASDTISSNPNAVLLSVDVMEAQRVWQMRVAAADKPMALDCSPEEYLATLARALSGADSNSSSGSARFQFRWSRTTRTLTLMEQTASGFTMKYAALTFTDAQEDEYWPELLRSVVSEHASLSQGLTRREKRIGELEALVRDKDALLAQALDAKQHEEDALMDGFCAVLNAKKDEIQRLQSELAAAGARVGGKQAGTSMKAQAKGRKAPSTGVKRARATRGAKLQKPQQKEEKADEESTNNSGGDDSDIHGDEAESDGGNDAEDGAGKKRARRQAVDAYSQLPSSLRPASQRVCSSDDVLSGLDAVMKSEGEASEATRENIKADTMPEPTAASGARKLPLRHTEQTPTTPTSAWTSKLRNPPADKSAKAEGKPPAPAVDSEEEDILDILS